MRRSQGNVFQFYKNTTRGETGMAKIILIRGNSDSEKTTVANELHDN